MIVINSAEYVIPELRSEIGMLPPVFLPVGNKKLLYLQVTALRRIFGHSEGIYVSLPENYQLSCLEKELLKKLQVQPIMARAGISLGLSLIYVLNKIGIYDSPLYLLHGDTLIEDLPTTVDCIAVSNTDDDYYFHDSHTGTADSLLCDHNEWRSQDPLPCANKNTVCGELDNAGMTLSAVSAQEQGRHAACMLETVPSTSAQAMSGDTVQLISGAGIGTGNLTSNGTLTISGAAALTADQENTSGQRTVWCGFFSFSSVKLFLSCLASVQGNFFETITQYGRAITLQQRMCRKWFDVGHVNTYFRTRSQITTERAFNELRISNGVVWKSGSASRKIHAEAAWFQAIPPAMRRYVPQFIQDGCPALPEAAENRPLDVHHETDSKDHLLLPGCGSSEKDRERGYFYETEFISCLPLDELYVHGRNSALFWSGIFHIIADLMRSARDCFPAGDEELSRSVTESSERMFRDKTKLRLKEYAKQSGMDLSSSVKYAGRSLPSIEQIAEECIKKSLALPFVPCVLHGDLCLSNILYDSRSRNLKLIDPRGMDTDGNFTVYGNQIYDLAKFCHSIIGMYDFIIADAFEVMQSTESGYYLTFYEDERYLGIQKVFLNHSFIPGVSIKEVLAPTVLLFLSMLPLHYDHPARQRAMLVNALRLYEMTL